MHQNCTATEEDDHTFTLPFDSLPFEPRHIPRSQSAKNIYFSLIAKQLMSTQEKCHEMNEKWRCTLAERSERGENLACCLYCTGCFDAGKFQAEWYVNNTLRQVQVLLRTTSAENWLGFGVSDDKKMVS